MAQSGSATSLFPQSSKSKLKRQSQSIIQQSSNTSSRYQYSQSVIGLESIAEEGSNSLFSIVDFSNTNTQQNKQKSSQHNYIVQDYLTSTPSTTLSHKKKQQQNQDDFFFDLHNNTTHEETKVLFENTRIHHYNPPLQDSSKLMIDTMLEDCKHFIVRGRQLPFDENDAVFSICQPAPKVSENPSGKCQVCLTSFKAIKNLSYCDFCGLQVCKTALCLVKSRPFPNNSQGLKGQVCLICDRKFYIRQMVKGTVDKIQENRLHIMQLQRDAEAKDKDCKAIDEEIEIYKEISAEEQQRQQTKMAEVNKQKKVIEIEILSISDDYKYQGQKRQAIVDELQFLSDTMDQINQDMEQRDEEILKLRIKIRQEDLEREKLEGQIQHLRRQISKTHHSRGKNAQQKPSSSEPKQIIDSRVKSPPPATKAQQPIDDPNDEMFFQQVDDVEVPDLLRNSTAEVPNDQYLFRSTIGAAEMETQGNEGESFSGIKAKKLAKRRLKDNQSFCGPPGYSGKKKKCNIF